MNNPKISIIVPVYNAEKYLHQCLDSILAQSFKDWECILVDDGSKDKSGEICDNYVNIDSRFCVIHKENEGVSIARNKGIDKSVGNWLIFVDSDDYIQTDYLMNLYSCTENDVDFVFTGFTKITDNKISDIVCFKSGLYGSEERSKIVGTLLSVGTPWGKAYRHEIIKRNNIKFDEKLSISEDRYFMYCYLPYVSNVYISNNSEYCYRIHQTSISFKARKPEEYIYRLDKLGKKAKEITSLWKLPLFSFIPFINTHLFFIEDIISRYGISFLKKNSRIIDEPDYFNIKKHGFRNCIHIYRLMGLKYSLLYNKRWVLYLLIQKIKKWF